MTPRAAWVPAFLIAIGTGLILWRLPGVYMDAVNPDYLVLDILHPGTHVFHWLPPGTLFRGKYPSLGQIYHGALPVYLGLPAYAAFGTGLFGIRMANTSFALLVLGGTFAMMRARGVRPLIAGGVLAAMAIDPGFVFAWRTQFYITLLPCALLTLSVALAARRPPAAAAAAGVCCGLACYGYFIYAFLAPVAFAAAWRTGRRPLTWLAGFVVGTAPYALGLLLLMRATGGPAAFPGVIASQMHGLGVTSSTLLPAARAALAWTLLRDTLLAVQPGASMLGETVAALGGPLRLGVLLGLPLLALTLGVLARNPAPALLAGWLTGFAALVLTFGSRLGAHHAVMLLPLLYAALADAFEWLARAVRAVHPARVAAAITFLLLGLFAGGAVDTARVYAALDRTGGVGLASDAINRFGADEAADASPRTVFMPDWGLFMSFALLTGGRVDYVGDGNPGWVTATLCGGRDAELALAAPETDRIAAWTRVAHLPDPAIRRYAQRDGAPLITVARWAAADRGTLCDPPGAR